MSRVVGLRHKWKRWALDSKYSQCQVCGLYREGFIKSIKYSYFIAVPTAHYLRPNTDPGCTPSLVHLREKLINRLATRDSP